jgi:Holliday junction resolvase RusA-like endonuclease
LKLTNKSRAYCIIQTLKLEGKESFTFFAIGKPIPKGSKSARVVKLKKTGMQRAVLFDVEKDLGRWEAIIKARAIATVPKDWDLEGRFFVSCVFFFQRPKIHFDSSGNIKEAYKSQIKTCTPDSDKLVRAVRDGLAMAAYSNDARVAGGSDLKLWANPPALPGALVSISRL